MMEQREREHAKKDLKVMAADLTKAYVQLSIKDPKADEQRLASESLKRNEEIIKEQQRLLDEAQENLNRAKASSKQQGISEQYSTVSNEGKNHSFSPRTKTLSDKELTETLARVQANLDKRRADSHVSNEGEEVITPEGFLSDRELRKRFRKPGVENHELSPPTKRTYTLKTPQEQAKEREGYQRFLTGTTFSVSGNPATLGVGTGNLAPSISASTSHDVITHNVAGTGGGSQSSDNPTGPSPIQPAPGGFSFSFPGQHRSFTPKERIVATAERFRKLMIKSKNLIGDVEFAPQSDKPIILARIQKHVQLLLKVENQVRSLKELDIYELEPEFLAIKHKISNLSLIPFEITPSTTERFMKGSELYYHQVETGKGGIIRERHMVPIGFDNEPLLSTNPDVKLFRERKHFAKIEKFTGEEGQCFMHWWSKFRGRIHLLPDLVNEDKYTTIQEYLGGEAKKVFLGARADKKMAFSESREYVTGLARLVAQYGRSERRMIDLKDQLDKFEILSIDPKVIKTKLAELSSIKGEMIITMDQDDSAEDLCYLVMKKFRKSAPCSLVAQVNTYISQTFGTEEANKKWGMIVDEALHFASQILTDTGYERDFDASVQMESRMQALEQKNSDLKTKISKYLDSPTESISRDKDTHRRAVRVSCLQETERKSVSFQDPESEESETEEQREILNSPEFQSYQIQQRAKSAQRFKGKPRPALKLPQHPASEPLYKNQAEVARYIESIRREKCFLHSSEKESHELWDCGMRAPTKMDILLNINRCRICLQPGHVGTECKVPFIPVCDTCGENGHVRIFCKTWLKEKAKLYADQNEENQNKYQEERDLAKKHTKTDPKITEHQTLAVARDYAPSTSYVAKTKPNIINPQDPIALD
jgi:hypothetical protein